MVLSFTPLRQPTMAYLVDYKYYEDGKEAVYYALYSDSFSTLHTLFVAIATDKFTTPCATRRNTYNCE